MLRTQLSLTKEEFREWRMGKSESVEYLDIDSVFAGTDFTKKSDPKRNARGGILELLENKSLSRGNWIVKNLFERFAVSILYGKTNVGKTFIVADMAVRMATGEPLFANPRFKVPKPLKVLCVCNEGTNSFPDRILTALEKGGFDTELFAENFRFEFTGVVIDDKANFQAFIDTWKDFSPDFVIIDTLRSATIQGEKEDGTSKIALIELRRMCREFGCHTMLIHHPTKAGDVEDLTSMSGSGAWSAGADVCLSVMEIAPEAKTVEDTVYVQLQSPKARDSAKIGTIYGASQYVVIGKDEDGDPISSRYYTWSTSEMTESQGTDKERILKFLQANINTLVSIKQIADNLGMDNVIISQRIKEMMETNKKIRYWSKGEVPTELLSELQLLDVHNKSKVVYYNENGAF